MGGSELHHENVHQVDPLSVPQADIAWASSLCTDLSLAGRREGLADGRESGAFSGFTHIIEMMPKDKRPSALGLENVTGLASSHDGNDSRTIVSIFNELGYSVDALEIDARRWVPQSRPRLFIIGLRFPVDSPDLLSSSLRPDRVAWIHSDPSLRTHVTSLPECPPLLSSGFSAIALEAPKTTDAWWSTERKVRFIDSLSQVQADRLRGLVGGDAFIFRTAYRRAPLGSISLGNSRG
jgi:DNA (cytosine-5)-methyltransferase 1